MRLFLLIFLCSCAAMTEDAMYEQENRLIEARDKFEMRSRSCRANGGVMMIEKFSRKHTAHEYRLARCVRL